MERVLVPSARHDRLDGGVEPRTDVRRRTVAIGDDGTTALRTLESAAAAGPLAAYSAATSIFITPGYQFRVADGLMTNFHLPKSTLFMLVSAMMGLDVMKRAYAHAVKERYRFFSYGDACLLLPSKD